MRYFASIKHQLKTLDMQNPGQWSAWIKAVFFGFLLVVCLAFFWLLLVKGKAAQLVAAKVQTQTLQLEYKNQTEQIANINAYRNQLTDQYQKHAGQLAKIPTKTSVESQIEQLTVLANDANIEVKNIALQSLTEQGDYLQQSINMQIAGQYQNLTAFLNKLQTMQNIITVHDFTLTPLNGMNDVLLDGQNNIARTADVTNPKLQFNVLLKTYVVNREYYGYKAGDNSSSVIYPPINDLDANDSNSNKYLAINSANSNLDSSLYSNVSKPMPVLVNPFAVPTALHSLLYTNKQPLPQKRTQPIQLSLQPDTPSVKTHTNEPELNVGSDNKLNVLQSVSENSAAIVEFNDSDMLTKVNPNRTREPLEYFELSTLKFKGVVVDPSGYSFALIERPDGVLVQIQKGSYLGRNSGKVTQITPRQLTLIETLVIDGNHINRQRVLSTASK